MLTYYLYTPITLLIAMVAAACLLVPMVGARTPEMLPQRSFSTPYAYILPLLIYIAIVAAACLPAGADGWREDQAVALQSPRRLQQIFPS